MMQMPLTLCYMCESDRILLGMKKRGFGAGRWNGFGGKVEAGETIKDAARREVREEIGVLVRALRQLGTLEFVFPSEEKAFVVHVFKADAYDGVPVETEEMRPAWFPCNAIPFDAMWPDDRYWLPLFIQDTPFEGRFVFKDEDTILSSDVRVLET